MSLRRSGPYVRGLLPFVQLALAVPLFGAIAVSPPLVLALETLFIVGGIGLARPILDRSQLAWYDPRLGPS